MTLVLEQKPVAIKLSIASGQWTGLLLVRCDTRPSLSPGGANGGSLHVIAQQRYNMPFACQRNDLMRACLANRW